MAWIAPAISAAAAVYGAATSGGKGSRRSPVHEELKRTQRGALNYLQYQGIPGASPLATAGSQAYLGLLGQQGIGLGDLGPLGEIAASGLPSDINPLVTATKDVAFRNIDEQAKALQSQFGPGGGRYSSDVYRGAGLVRERGAQDLNEQLLNLAYGASEAAAGRRLVGSELLLNYGQSARRSALEPILAGLGLQIPDIQPSAASQAALSIAPALAYGTASRPTSGTGGKGGASAGGKGAATNTAGGIPTGQGTYAL